MFAITEFTEARLATLTSRSEFHGDDEVPAVTLGIEIEGPNTMLDCIDPAIREGLYKRADTEDIPGVEPSTPVLRCNSIDRTLLATKCDGWTLLVDDGLDDTEPAVFGGVNLTKFSVEAKQGGTVVLRLKAGTSDLDTERSGMLGMHIGQSIWIKVKPPEKQPDAIDASSSARDLPLDVDAGSLFAQEHGPRDGPDDAAENHPGHGEDGGPWAFPNGASDEAPPQSAVEEDPLLLPAEAHVITTRRASVSSLQRHLGIGHGRAALLLEALERSGVVSAVGEDGKREVLAPVPAVETSRPGTRTARGREKTKTALARREGAAS